MASAKLLTVASLTAASISVMAFAGCQPSPTAPPTGGGISLDPIAPPTMDPLPTDEPGDEPYEPGDEPFEPEPGDEEPAEPQDPTGQGTVTGWIYDDAGNKLDGVTITAKTLSSGTFPNGSDTLVVTTTQGRYTLEGAPAGVTVYVRATKPGYTTRQQTIVPAPGSDEAANALSFGDPAKDPALLYALSNKPEVVSFTPQDAATGIDAKTSFTLTFSTAVRPADVVDNFAVYVAGTAGGSHALTTPGVSLMHRYDPAKDIGGSGNGYSAVIPSTSAFIYDAKTSMDATWSDGNRTVTFAFKPGIQLPTDKVATKAPKYAMSFKGGTIYDSTGTYGRSDFWFRPGSAMANRVGVSFTVAADITAPQLQSITATNENDDPNQNTDVILAKFSEPMVLYPNDQDGKSIPRDAAGSGYALLPKMFKYYVSSKDAATLPNGGAALPGGFAFNDLGSPSSGFLPFAVPEWDSSDESKSTIKLVPLSNSPNGSGKGWVGDTVASSSAGSITVTTGVTNLNVGDLLQSGTSVYRVAAITDDKTMSVTQYGSGPAPTGSINYWEATTTNPTNASTGIEYLWLNSVTGLRKGDSLSVPIKNEPPQVVTLTENPNPSVNNIVRFTPALNGHVDAGKTVTFVSPLSAGHTGFGPNYTVWLGVNPAVTDPAGNAVSTSGNGHIKSVTAI